MSTDLQFRCPMTFSAAPSAATDVVQFVGLAYSGDLMLDAPGGPAVVDISTLIRSTPLPLLLEHDHKHPVGIVDAMTVGAELRITGRLFATDPRGAEVVEKGRRGFPWGLSIGLFAVVEAVALGESRTVNGRPHTGPFRLLTRGRLREISVVSVAADAEATLQFNRPLRAHRMPNGRIILI